MYMIKVGTSSKQSWRVSGLRGGVWRLEDAPPGGAEQFRECLRPREILSSLLQI